MFGITYKNIKKVYGWMLTAAFLFMIMAVICQDIFAGPVSAWLFGIGFVLFIVACVLETRYWRCPFCHEPFSRYMTIEAQVCPYCKRELHLDD